MQISLSGGPHTSSVPSATSLTNRNSSRAAYVAENGLNVLTEVKSPIYKMPVSLGDITVLRNVFILDKDDCVQMMKFTKLQVIADIYFGTVKHFEGDIEKAEKAIRRYVLQGITEGARRV